MNRKEAIAVTALLFGFFITGAFADTVTTSPTRTTIQTTALSIEVLDVIPGLGFAGGGGIFLFNPPGVNLTAGFSFAPVKGFLTVMSAELTIVYLSTAGTPPTNTAFTVGLNGQLSGTVPINPVSSGTQIMLAGPVSIQSIRVGSNTMSVGLTPGYTAHVYEVRLTVEYTFQG